MEMLHLFLREKNLNFRLLYFFHKERLFGQLYENCTWLIWINSNVEAVAAATNHDDKFI